VPGDFTGDGVVDAADYTVWRDNLGTADESSLGGNGDGARGVGQGDYALWQANFGVGAASANPGQAPEPTALALVLGAATALGIPLRAGRR
jgi:hypothetical protein